MTDHAYIAHVILADSQGVHCDTTCARHEAVLADRMYKVLSMPVNWDIMMENTMDPSHANWLHDGFAGKWEDSTPMRMRVTHAPSDPNQVRFL